VPLDTDFDQLANVRGLVQPHLESGDSSAYFVIKVYEFEAQKKTVLKLQRYKGIKIRLDMISSFSMQFLKVHVFLVVLHGFFDIFMVMKSRC
jgi:hypothetical protein